ncbi:MAG: hypothetical protein J6X49_04265 [Victivallales bacterium]|nr:hypothetical protein [Victivallales bacterium]
MKKYILTAFIIIVCVLNVQAQTIKPGNAWPSKNGRTSTNPDEVAGQLYHAVGAEKIDGTGNVTGNVEFNYTWSAGRNAPENQMWSYERTDIDAGWRYEGGTFEFTSDYVWTDFGTRLDDHKGDPGTITEFGYYKINTDGTIGVPTAMMELDADGNKIVNNSVIFKEGDKIGFYMEIAETNGNNVIFTSTENAIEGAAKAAPNVDTDSRGDEKQYFCLFDARPGKPGIASASHYEYFLDGFLAKKDDQTYEQFIDEVIEQNGGNTNITDSDGNAVGGQPLPGLLLTMVIGGTAVAGIAKKRKKA